MTFILFFFLFHKLLKSFEIKPKLCTDCIFFKKSIFTPNKFGKCSLFPLEDTNADYYLVDGIKTTMKQDYYFCSVARKYDNLCGINGIKYIKKN